MIFVEIHYKNWISLVVIKSLIDFKLVSKSANSKLYIFLLWK